MEGKEQRQETNELMRIIYLALKSIDLSNEEDSDCSSLMKESIKNIDLSKFTKESIENNIDTFNRVEFYEVSNFLNNYLKSKDLSNN